MENMLNASTIEEAMKRPDWPLFKIAMDTEMEAMKRTGTFGNGPIPRPPDKNIIGSKWTLRIKRKANGEIDKYKAQKFIWNRHHITQTATQKMLFNYDTQYTDSNNQVVNGMRS